MKVKLSVILSITHDKLLCDFSEVRKFFDNDIYKLTFYDPLHAPYSFTSEKDYLLRQLPFLKDIDVSHIDEYNWKIELEKLEKQYGESFDLKSELTIISKIKEYTQCQVEYLKYKSSLFKWGFKQFVLAYECWNYTLSHPVRNVEVKCFFDFL